MRQANVLKRIRNRLLFVVFVVAFALFCGAALSGCAVQQGPSTSTDSTQAGQDLRIVATTPAIAQICERLDLDLVGVPESENVPDRYADVTTVGAAMSPDMEILASLNPDIVLSPITLESDLAPKYEAAGIEAQFLDVSSVEGMFSSIQELGQRFGREAEAQALASEHTAFMDAYNAQVAGQTQPSVLVLMGVPGSYIVATEQSYVGSLVKLAGGQNIYADSEGEFVASNTEDMLARDPDIILRASHGIPDEVGEMFAEEFSTNDIWTHFRAVQEGRVYDLPYETFGMSATLSYTDALDYLAGLLYPQASAG